MQIFNGVNEDFYIKLTLAAYRVTELFPEGEPLKLQIRESANQILADLIRNNSANISENIQVLKEFLNLAEKQNWVDSRNFFVLQREYDKIEKLIPDILISSGKSVENSFSRPNNNKRNNKERKQKILELLAEKKKIQLKELTRNFPQVSKRTLMRDLEEFYQLGMVIKVGNGRASFYNIKS